jgi:hypothetical protein
VAEESFDRNAMVVANGVNPKASYWKLFELRCPHRATFVPIQKAQVATIDTTLRHDAPIVGLGVAHFTDTLSRNDQEETRRP